MNQLLKYKKTIVLGVAIIIAVALVSLASYQQRYNLSNIDGISYISIASQYANGELGHAINGHWSPLISWMMTPFIYFGIEGVAAFRIINALAAAGAIIVGTLYIYLSKINNRRALPALLYVALITPLLINTMNDSFSPDVLVIAWVVCFIPVLTFFIEKLSSNNIGEYRLLVTAVLFGIFGALGYFTKAYLLPVFATVMVAILMTSICLILRKQHRKKGIKVFRAASITVLAFVIVALPWIRAMSDKYGYLTAGYALHHSVDRKIVGNRHVSISHSNNEASNPDQDDKRVYSLQAPPNDTSIDPSEEMTPYKDEFVSISTDRNSSSAQDKNTPSRGLEYIQERFASLPYYIANISDIWIFTFIFPAALIGFMVFSRRFRVWLGKSGKVVVASAAVYIVYFSGYAAITTQTTRHGNSRYYWPLTVICVFMMCILFATFLSSKHSLLQNRATKIIILAFIPVTLVVSMLRTNPIGGTVLTNQSPTGIHSAAQEISERGLVNSGDNIASNNNRQTHRLALLIGARQYDILENGKDIDGLDQDPVGLSNDTLKESFDKHDIRYYLHFEPASGNFRYNEEEYALIMTHSLGNLACEDARYAQHEMCDLYILKPIFNQ